VIPVTLSLVGLVKKKIALLPGSFVGKSSVESDIQINKGDSTMADHKETKKEPQHKEHTTSHSQNAERKEAEQEIREAARHAAHERDDERKQAEEEIREAARKVAEEPDKSKKQKKR
jgi:hypothetical protein